MNKLATCEDKKKLRRINKPKTMRFTNASSITLIKIQRKTEIINK